jgi:UDP-N-acetylglucosamine:LPS N-acetylglucosamine transferase
MVFLPSVPGQEQANAEFFARRGAGCIARNMQEVVSKTAELLREPERRRAMSEAAGELYRPGVETILKTIL